MFIVLLKLLRLNVRKLSESQDSIVAVRIQVPKKAALVRFVLHPWGRAFLIGFVVINTLLLALFTFSYVKYSRQIDEKLRRRSVHEHVDAVRRARRW